MWRDVAQAVERDGVAVRTSADQPSALLRRGCASVGDHRLNMFATELNRWHGQSETTRRCSSSNCLGSTSPGASIIRSAADAVLGNAITSRMLSVPASTRSEE